MKVAIHQPNFLPWLGYFHKLLNCDVFIFLDSVQFPRGRCFTSRVAIKSPSGSAWLTVPVKGKGDLLPIKDVALANDRNWKSKHLKTLEGYYKKAPHFAEYYPLIYETYQLEDQNLANFNINLITNLAKSLSAPARLVRASELKNVDYTDSTNHLIKLVKHVGGTEYLTGTGKGSQRYIDEAAFRREGIKVFYQSFVHPTYPQLWGDFIPNLSVVDLLFNSGMQARDIILANKK
ncbi:MAG: WbqC family protein [Desulfotomaculaceae bacterium]|nr:WbqC family protein [Desulfotomaculaceae bacterium]